MLKFHLKLKLPLNLKLYLKNELHLKHIDTTHNTTYTLPSHTHIPEHNATQRPFIQGGDEANPLLGAASLLNEYVGMDDGEE